MLAHWTKRIYPNPNMEVTQMAVIEIRIPDRLVQGQKERFVEAFSTLDL